MGRYRKIDPRIWNDEKFRMLSDSGKLIFLFLLTHPHMTALGAMRATVSGLAEELGWNTEVFREAFHEVLAKGMAEHDQKACLIGLLLSLHHELQLEVEPLSVWPLQQYEVLHAREHFSQAFHTPEAFSILRRAGP